MPQEPRRRSETPGADDEDENFDFMLASEQNDVNWDDADDVKMENEDDDSKSNHGNPFTSETIPKN